MRDQRLPLVVVERVLAVPEIERDAIGYVREERRRQRLARIVIPASRIMLPQRQRPVGGHIRQDLIATVGPDHAERVNLRRATEPEVQA